MKFRCAGTCPAVHVHGVTQDLERIEADADRKRKAQQRHGQPGQRVQVCDHEIGILEIRKRPEAQENRQDQKQLRPPGIAEALDQPSENIALQDGDEHDRQIARLTPAVKHKARQEQHAVFRPFGYEKVDKQDSGEKIKQKRNTRKQHGGPFGLHKLIFHATIGSSVMTTAPEYAACSLSRKVLTRSSAPKHEIR